MGCCVVHAVIGIDQTTTGVASKSKRADPSATEAAREPDSDAHKGHDSSGTRRGLRNGGVTWAFKGWSGTRRGLRNGGVTWAFKGWFHLSRG